jgi:hypothetical protein
MMGALIEGGLIGWLVVRSRSYWGSLQGNSLLLSYARD